MLSANGSGGHYIASLPVSVADNAIYSQLEAVFTNAVAAVNGTPYSTGTTSNHAGTSDEYMFFGHRVFAFDTECGLSFQPSWTTAQPTIQEVTAGFRALALATLELEETTPTPLAVVQSIDRTGSMVTFGYDTSARNNAKRFVDLLSLGDSTGIVTFADPSSISSVTPVTDRSQIEYPLTLLDDPGDAFEVSAAIDMISFGGWTPIGAGLERSASLLTSASLPRGILLLSDGYENREPNVVSVLDTWPNDLPVYSIALGPSADTETLSNIAEQTGGTFQISPTALDLHLVYNQMRVDMSDVDTIVNKTVQKSHKQEATHEIEVETGVKRLEVSLSSDTAVPGQFVLRSPSGRDISTDDYGITLVHRKSYIIIGISRPEAGRWILRVAGVSSDYAIAAFVRSPLKIKTWFDGCLGGKRTLNSISTFDGKELSKPRIRIRSQLINVTPKIGRSRFIGKSEREDQRATPLNDTSPDKSRKGPLLHWPDNKIKLPRGLSRVYIEIDGKLPGGAVFRRIVLHTIRA